MSNSRLWRIENNLPYRSKPSYIPLEKDLEYWIEADTSLVQDNLIIVGRQLRVQGGIIDLLAIDSDGRKWHIIEIKRQKVDDKTVGQALRYAAWIKNITRDELQQKMDGYLKNTLKMSFLQLVRENRWDHVELFNKRELVIYLVGTRQSVNLKETAQLLTNSGINTQVITLQVFEDEYNRQILLRDVTVLESQEMATISSQIKPTSPIPNMDMPFEELLEPESGQKISPESLFSVAESRDIGREFRALFDVATKYGLYPRTYKHSIMYTPPQNKTRVLLCVWVNPVSNYPHCVSVYINPEAFAEFFPISEEKATRYLGRKGQYVMALARIEAFAQGMDNLFSEINNAR